MMPRSRTALGISISEGRINLALVKASRGSVRLLKADSGPVPAGAIEHGNIQDAKALAKAIKKLKIKNRIRSRRTVFSLVASPTLMQILELPDDARSNVRQFVNEQVKHYAVLPMKTAAVDFCGITSSAKSSKHRVLLVATDGQKIAPALRTFNTEGVSIDAVEPAWIAYIRACYAQEVARRPDTNLLLAMVCDGTVTLSVFSKQTLDFVRTERFDPDTLQSDEYLEWLAEKINAVLTFYELDASKEHCAWQVTLVADIRSESVRGTTEWLSARLSPAKLQVRTLEHARLTMAAGLAMKLLNNQEGGLNIDLLPPELKRAKLAETRTLVIANVAAAVILLMILSTGFFVAKVQKAIAGARQAGHTQVRQDTATLLSEQALVQEQITDISNTLDMMDNVLSAESVLWWGQVLADIRLATPQAVQITGLVSSDNSKVLLDGRSLSYVAVYQFVDALKTSENMESVSLIGTERPSGSDGLVKYSIRCLLADRKGAR